MQVKTLLSSCCSLIAAAALAIPSPAAALAMPSPAAATPQCAWYELSVTTDNTAAPDSAATYWLTPFTVQDSLQIRLDGRYPDSRYASLQAYQANGDLYSVNGVTSGLTDYQIQPNPGSVNPWQPTGHRRLWGQDAFTVTLQSDVAPGEANMLPLAPAGTAPGIEGYLVYRVYLPAGGDFSQVPLPAVTFTLNGVSQQVPDCPPSTASTASTVAPAAAASRVTPDVTGATAETVQFSRPADIGAFPNADTGYLEAQVTPPSNGDVLVIQGKAPTASRGSHPSPWPAPYIDLRYWSLCNYLRTSTVPLVANPLPDGQTDYGCRDDSQVALDRYGYYTFVVGTEGQRPVIDRIPGATFLPFSAAQPMTTHVLLLRNMLANPGFAEAVQNVPANGSPASAAAVMGPYFPRTAMCPLSTLARSGPAACFAGT